MLETIRVHTHSCRKNSRHNPKNKNFFDLTPDDIEELIKEVESKPKYHPTGKEILKHYKKVNKSYVLVGKISAQEFKQILHSGVTWERNYSIQRDEPNALIYEFSDGRTFYFLADELDNRGIDSVDLMQWLEETSVKNPRKARRRFKKLSRAAQLRVSKKISKLRHEGISAKRAIGQAFGMERGGYLKNPIADKDVEKCVEVLTVLARFHHLHDKLERELPEIMDAIKSEGLWNEEDGVTGKGMKFLDNYERTIKGE